MPKSPLRIAGAPAQVAARVRAGLDLARENTRPS